MAGRFEVLSLYETLPPQIVAPKGGGGGGGDGGYDRTAPPQLPPPSTEQKTVSPTDDSKAQVSKFLEGSFLGKGSFGTVSTVLYNGQTMVIKKILRDRFAGTEHANNQEVLARAKRDFASELEVLQHLKSDNQCKTFALCLVDSFEDAEAFYIVTAFLGGYMTLAEFIHKNSWELKCALAPKITAHLILALDELHNAGVVHRDLKPANIMINGDLSKIDIKIIDYGVSRIADFDDVVSGPVAHGTYAYRSPETYLERSNQTGGFWRLVDYWAMACTLFDVFSPRQMSLYEAICDQHALNPESRYISTHYGKLLQTQKSVADAYSYLFVPPHSAKHSIPVHCLDAMSALFGFAPGYWKHADEKSRPSGQAFRPQDRELPVRDVVCWGEVDDIDCKRCVKAPSDAKTQCQGTCTGSGKQCLRTGTRQDPKSGKLYCHQHFPRV